MHFTRDKRERRMAIAVGRGRDGAGDEDGAHGQGGAEGEG